MAIRGGDHPVSLDARAVGGLNANRSAVVHDNTVVDQQLEGNTKDSVHEWRIELVEPVACCATGGFRPIRRFRRGVRTSADSGWRAAPCSVRIKAAELRESPP